MVGVGGNIIWLAYSLLALSTYGMAPNDSIDCNYYNYNFYCFNAGYLYFYLIIDRGLSSNPLSEYSIVYNFYRFTKNYSISFGFNEII